MKKILLCDDEKMNRVVASKILKKEGYEVIEAENGEEALKILERESIDLVLMDLMMPVMDGFEATKRIKSDPNTALTPLIIVSALSDKEAIHKGLQLGADEYLTKPFDLVEFRLRINNALKMGDLQNRKSEREILDIMGKMAEYRDNETSMHTKRVGEFAAILAKAYGWSHDDVELMRLAAPLHDVGKIGIPDAILLKPARLSAEEFSIMQRHVQIGYELLSQKDSPLLHLAAQIALTHHEKYDGSGYPQGLRKDEIPISGAIVAVVDVFDALSSERPYKKAFSIQESIAIIKEGRGSHFHPEIVDLFLENIEEIVTIKQRYHDQDVS